MPSFTPTQIIIGTIGHSGLIDSLVRNGKINIAAIAGKWESFQIQVVRDAFYELVFYPTKASALVTEINIFAGRNRLYALQGRTSTTI